MKNMTKFLSVVILASIFFMSCDKKEDDEKTETKNFLKVGDIEYNFSAGILNNYGTDDDSSWHYGYNTELTLYSEGLSLQTNEENDWSFVGKGHAIFFNMFSTAGNALDHVNYAFTSFNSVEPSSIGTFAGGAYVINYDTQTEISIDEGEIASGTVSVSKSGSEYSITIDCTGFNGKKITGFYKGTLRYLDSSAVNKSASFKSTKLTRNIF